MTTTSAAIRDAMVGLVEAITPAIHAGDKFIAHRELKPLRAWAEANPTTCLRRFSIRYTGSFAPPSVSNTRIEETSDTFEVVIAYPTSGRFGGDFLTALDDTIASDQLQVHAAIGPPGYASLTAAACVLAEDPWDREDGDAVTFAVIRYRVLFYRAVP